MAVEKTIMHIPFIKGLDTESNEYAVEPPGLVVAENIDLDRFKGLNQRDGYTSLTVLDGTPTNIIGFGDGFGYLSVDDQTGEDATHFHRYLHTGEFSDFSFASTYMGMYDQFRPPITEKNIISSDSASALGVTCTVIDTGGVVEAYFTDRDGYHMSTVTIDAGGNRPKVETVEDSAGNWWFFVVYRDAVGNVLAYYKVRADDVVVRSSAAYGDITADTSTAFISPDAPFDICTDRATSVTVAWQDSFYRVTCAEYDGDGYMSHAPTFLPGTSIICDIISCSTVPGRNERLVAARAKSTKSTTALWFNVTSPSTIVFQRYEALGAVNNSVAHADNMTCYVYDNFGLVGGIVLADELESIIAYDKITHISGIEYFNKIVYWNTTFAGSDDGTTKAYNLFLPNHQLAAGSVTVLQNSYTLAVRCPTQITEFGTSSHVLIAHGPDSTPTPISALVCARFSHGTAMFYNTQVDIQRTNLLGNISIDDNQDLVIPFIEANDVYGIESSTSSVYYEHGIYTTGRKMSIDASWGARVGKFSRNGRFDTINLLDSTLLAGSVPAITDGNSIHSINFGAIPEVSFLSNMSKTAGALNAYYRLYWEYISPTGEVERSTFGASIAFEGVTAASFIEVVVPTSLVFKPYRVVAFASTDGVNFYRHAESDPIDRFTTYSVSDMYVTLDLGRVDTISTNTELDLTFNSGALDAAPVPPIKLAAYGKNRLFYVAAGENIVRYTNPKVVGSGFVFNEALQISIPAEGGKITALLAGEDYLWVFKQRAIFYIRGQGPNSLGAGEPFGYPQMISGNIGAESSHAVTRLPSGVLCKSDKGWYRINSGLGIEYAGVGVKAYDDETIVCKGELPDEHLYLFATPNRTLVYHALLGEWTTYDITPSSMGRYKDKLVFLDGETIYIQDTTTGASNGVQTPVDIETGWIDLSGVMGYARASRYGIMGKVTGNVDLRIRVAYDGEDTYTDDRSVMAIGSGSSPTDPAPLEIRGRFSRQKCRSVKFKITSGDGYTSKNLVSNDITSWVGTGWINQLDPFKEISIGPGYALREVMNIPLEANTVYRVTARLKRTGAGSTTYGLRLDMQPSVGNKVVAEDPYGVNIDQYMILYKPEYDGVYREVNAVMQTGDSPTDVDVYLYNPSNNTTGETFLKELQIEKGDRRTTFEVSEITTDPGRQVNFNGISIEAGLKPGTHKKKMEK